MASFSANLSKDVEISKKDKRLEAKKKKAVALLQLIEMKQSQEDDSPAKRVRLEVGSCPIGTTDNRTSDLPNGKKALNVDERYVKAKQVIRERQKAAMARPKIFLTLDNLLPSFQSLENKEESDGKNRDDSTSDSVSAEVEQKTAPLFMMDLQHLLMYSLMKERSSFQPRWCKVLRPAKISSVVFIVLNDVSIEDFQQHPEGFPFIKENFPTYVEMVSPSQYGSSLDQDVYAVPLSISQMKKYTRRPELREKVLRLISVPPSSSSGAGTERTSGEETQRESPEASETKDEAEGSRTGDVVPRTSLMLNTTQLMMEGYPLPVTTGNKKYEDFILSKDSYCPVKRASPIFAVDCEMCLTCAQKNELTRVSIVNEQNDVIYDKLVKPRNRIINYLTKWSGITKSMLDPVTTRLEDVQEEIKELLPPDAILCGQSLCNDLCALKMMHPYVIDTSVIYNMSGSRNVKCGLKRLSNLFLGRTIQSSKNGHCSAEDAAATMDLVKLKLSKGLDFGDAVLGGVYFPDMKTYFLSPGSAQNVQETFQQGQSRQQLPSRIHAGRNDVQGSSAGNGKKPKTLRKGKKLDEESRKVFFQQDGSKLMHSFFELLADHNFSVGLIGNEELASKYRSEPKLTVEALDTDKKCWKEAASMCQEKDLTWLDLQAAADLMSGECTEEDLAVNSGERMSIFNKLDKYVRKLVGKTRERTLVVIAMTGRNFQGRNLNAATFVKIT